MAENDGRTWGKWITESRNNFRRKVHQIIQCDEDKIGCGIGTSRLRSALSFDAGFSVVTPAARQEGAKGRDYYR